MTGIFEANLTFIFIFPLFWSFSCRHLRNHRSAPQNWWYYACALGKKWGWFDKRVLLFAVHTAISKFVCADASKRWQVFAPWQPDEYFITGRLNYCLPSIFRLQSYTRLQHKHIEINSLILFPSKFIFLFLVNKSMILFCNFYLTLGWLLYFPPFLVLMFFTSTVLCYGSFYFASRRSAYGSF